MPTPSQCQAIHAELLAAKGAWVPMPMLSHISQSLNVHSRIDELRHKRGVMIENKKERDEAQRRRTRSFYRIPLSP
ncbi:MAG: hypothetical protein WCK77_24255 [Verrucomicrobiota bacterium]